LNVFCAEQTRSRDAVTSRKRDVAALLHRCDAVVAYNGTQFDLPLIQQWLQSSARGGGGAAANVALAGSGMAGGGSRCLFWC